MDYFNDDSSSDSISLFSVSIMLEKNRQVILIYFSVSIIITKNRQVIVTHCFLYLLFQRKSIKFSASIII